MKNPMHPELVYGDYLIISREILILLCFCESRILKVGRDAATSDFVQVFLGIPYASPPTGNYRLIKMRTITVMCVVMTIYIKNIPSVAL